MKDEGFPSGKVIKCIPPRIAGKREKITYCSYYNPRRSLTFWWKSRHFSCRRLQFTLVTIGPERVTEGRTRRENKCVPVQTRKLILQMRERYIYIHKQIDIAEHNEKIYCSLWRVIRVFYRNITNIEEKLTLYPITPFCFSFGINRSLNLVKVCQFKDLVTAKKRSSICTWI